MPSPAHRTTYLVLWIVFLVLCAPSLLFAIWALYDGTVYYPDKVAQYQAFEQVKQQYPDTWQSEWPRVARTNGWPANTQPEPYDRWDVITQYIMMSVCGFIGLAFGVAGLVFLALWRKTSPRES